MITDVRQDLCRTGKATFDGYIVNKDWAKANKDFMVKFVKVLAAADDNYRKNKAKWSSRTRRKRRPSRSGRARSPRTFRPAWRCTSSRRRRNRRPSGSAAARTAVAAKALAATADVPAVAEADREDAAGLLGRGQSTTHDAASEIARMRRNNGGLELSKLEVRHLSVTLHRPPRGGRHARAVGRQSGARPRRFRRRARRVGLRQDDAAFVHRRIHAVFVGRDSFSTASPSSAPAPSAASCSRSTR